MCCGSRRSAWRGAAAAPATSRPAASGETSRNGAEPTGARTPASAQGLFPSVLLAYLDGAAIRVRGPVTGRRYDFSDAQSAQAVDARDAAVLTRNVMFRRAES